MYHFLAACYAKIADVMFVVDSSGSVGPHNFDIVIQRINDQYGTNFKAPRLDAAFDQQVKELVEDMNRAESVSGGEVDERRVARPSIVRARLRAIPEQQLEDRRVQPYLERAKATYERWR